MATPTISATGSYITHFPFHLTNTTRRFGGQAVSLAVNYTYKSEFAAAGYAPFVVDDTEYGEVRQYGNFSFLRIYEAGHEVPFYQPIATLEMFRRVILGLDLADGDLMVSSGYATEGNVTATHSESFVALPTTSKGSAMASNALASGTGAVML